MAVRYGNRAARQHDFHTRLSHWYGALLCAGAIETRLAANSQLTYTKPLVSQAITATTKAARRLRTGLAIGQLASAAVQVRDLDRAREGTVKARLS